MSPEFPMPDDAAPTDPPRTAAAWEEVRDLLRESDDRKSALEKLRRTVDMLKELHNATVAAFREELQRAVKERIIAEVALETAWADHNKRWSETTTAHKHEVKKWVGRCSTLLTALHNLHTSANRIDADTIPPEIRGPLTTHMVEAGELIAVALDYLD